MQAEVDYPTELIDIWWAGATRVLVRPVLPQDAPLCQAFVRELSPESRYRRFQSGLKELSPEMLGTLTRIDFRDHVALVAEIRQRERAVLIGEARYVRSGNDTVCDFAMAVADAWQGKGIGRRLLAALRRHARQSGFETMRGEVLSDNGPMLSLARHAGMRVRAHPEDRRLMWIEAPLTDCVEP